MKTIVMMLVMLAACAMSEETYLPDAGTSTLSQRSTENSICTTTECDANGNCWEVASDCGGAGGGGGTGGGGGGGGTGGGGGGGTSSPPTCGSTCLPELGYSADAYCSAACGGTSNWRCVANWPGAVFGACVWSPPCGPGNRCVTEPPVASAVGDQR